VAILVGAAALISCFVNTVYPVPKYPDSLWPYVVAAWVAAAVAILWLRPAIGRAAELA
jgi:hypothetical protein